MTHPTSSSDRRVDAGSLVAPRNWRAVTGDVLAILAVALSLLLWAPPDIFPRPPHKIYVSPTGSNWCWGASPSHALSSIQRAVDMATPGDEIVLLPGRYQERVCIQRSGTPSHPIRVRAQTPGTVVVSGEGRGWPYSRTAWSEEGAGIYGTVPPWPIYGLRVGGQSALPCKTLATLKSFTALPNARAAFCQERGRLYLYLPAGARPRQCRIETHGPVPAQLANGVWRAANVWVDADYVHLEGIHFDWGVASGVRIWRGRSVVVSNCLFTGAKLGVNAAFGVGSCENLIVEYCGYHNYPQAEWRRTWLPKNTLYDYVTGNCLLLSVDDGAIVRHNLVVHANDGLKVTTGDERIRSGEDVFGNLIAYCTDDAIEFDGFAKKVRFHHNLIYDCHESLGISPVLAGPVDISHNLFLHPSGGINAAQVKLLSPGLERGPPLNGPIRNVKIHHNTFVGNWLCWWNESPVEDVWISHNVFAVKRRKAPPWPPGVTAKDNVLINLPAAGYANPGRDPKWLRNELAPSRRDGMAQLGGDSTCCGATRPGERWAMPRPGPDWLDWRQLPATRPLLDDLAEDLFLQ